MCANAHAFSFTALEGGDLPLAQWAGQPILIVNTASQCGFTPQFAGLQRLHERFSPAGLVVLGVPSNDFRGQEPLDASSIRGFCDRRFGVTFPLTAKTHVRGADAHPFYKWAAERAGWMGKPRWNFHKYLIGANGHLADWFSTLTPPSAGSVEAAIERALEHQYTER